LPGSSVGVASDGVAAGGAGVVVDCTGGAGAGAGAGAGEVTGVALSTGPPTTCSTV
jgi:hypothetical protein